MPSITTYTNREMKSPRALIAAGLGSLVGLSFLAITNYSNKVEELGSFREANRAVVSSLSNLAENMPIIHSGFYNPTSSKKIK